MVQRISPKTGTNTSPARRFGRLLPSGFEFRSLCKSPVRSFLLCACICSLWQTDTAQSAERVNGEPGWMPVIFATGELREKIEATPIEQRPYRPFHFYGNTVRRRYYHGTAIPRLRNVSERSSRNVAERSWNTPR